MRRYYCPKCNQPEARFICCNGDGVYLAGLAFDCVACGYQWEAEEYPRVAERKAPTTAHLIAEALDLVKPKDLTTNNGDIRSDAEWRDGWNACLAELRRQAEGTNYANENT